MDRTQDNSAQIHFLSNSTCLNPFSAQWLNIQMGTNANTIPYVVHRKSYTDLQVESQTLLLYSCPFHIVPAEGKSRFQSINCTFLCILSLLERRARSFCLFCSGFGFFWHRWNQIHVPAMVLKGLSSFGNQKFQVILWSSSKLFLHPSACLLLAALVECSEAGVPIVTEEAVRGKESKELVMGYRYRLDLFLNVQCLDLFCDSYILMTLYCAVSSLRCCLFSALSYHSCGKLLLTCTCFDLHEICFYKNGNDKGSSSLKAIWP